MSSMLATLAHEVTSQDRSAAKLEASIRDIGNLVEALQTDLSHLKDEVKARRNKVKTFLSIGKRRKYWGLRSPLLVLGSTWT